MLCLVSSCIRTRLWQLLSAYHFSAVSLRCCSTWVRPTKLSSITILITTSLAFFPFSSFSNISLIEASTKTFWLRTSTCLHPVLRPSQQLFRRYSPHVTPQLRLLESPGLPLKREEGCHPTCCPSIIHLLSTHHPHLTQLPPSSHPPLTHLFSPESRWLLASATPDSWPWSLAHSSAHLLQFNCSVSFALSRSSVPLSRLVSSRRRRRLFTLFSLPVNPRPQIRPNRQTDLTSPHSPFSSGRSDTSCAGFGFTFSSLTSAATTISSTLSCHRNSTPPRLFSGSIWPGHSCFRVDRNSGYVSSFLTTSNNALATGGSTTSKRESAEQERTKKHSTPLQPIRTHEFSMRCQSHNLSRTQRSVQPIATETRQTSRVLFISIVHALTTESILQHEPPSLPWPCFVAPLSHSHSRSP